MTERAERLETEEGSLETYVLKNRTGSVLTVTNYGGRIMGLCVPDREGALADVSAGFDRAEEYRGDNPYFGALIGRVANRVAGATYRQAGQIVRLDDNDNGACLHGGFAGYDRRLWQARPEGDALRLELHSPAGDQGFPGALEVSVLYRLTDENALELEYEAAAEQDTPCNLTNHCYFHLGGGEDILGHELAIHADFISEWLPEENRGRLVPVAGTPLDFSIAKPVGRDLGGADARLRAAGGYDFNYVLRGRGFQRAATLYEPRSGRLMEVWTDRPGLQLYTGNFIERIEGKRLYRRHTALCLEAQDYPYALNEPSFPSILLKGGERYRQRTVYRFSVR